MRANAAAANAIADWLPACPFRQPAEKLLRRLETPLASRAGVVGKLPTTAERPALSGVLFALGVPLFGLPT